MSQPRSARKFWSVSSTTPAWRRTVAEASSKASIAPMRSTLSTTSPARGTPPPTIPVLPACGTRGTSSSAQAASTAATSSVERGRTTSGA